MISFSFVPTRDDYLKGFRAFYLKNWLLWAGLVCLMLAQVVCISLGLLRGVPNLILDILLPLLIFVLLAFYLTFVLVINPRRMASRVDKDERLSSPLQYEADNVQLKYQNGFSEGSVYWRSFDKVLETKEHFLLVYTADKNMFQIIPKRAFTSAEHERAFRRLLDVKIPQER